MKTAQTVEVIVNNDVGVLNRLTHLFLRKGFNIERLHVEVEEDKRFSRIIIDFHPSTIKDGNMIDQIVKQLEKQIDVIQVHAR